MPLLNVIADGGEKMLARRTHHINLMRQICILADADIELHGPGLQLPLANSTPMSAVKEAAPFMGSKRTTTYVKFLVPLLELGCTQLAQVVYNEGDRPCLIPGSRLGQIFGDNSCKTSMLKPSMSWKKTCASP